MKKFSLLLGWAFFFSPSWAPAARLPANNYECVSVATPVVAGKFGSPNRQSRVVGYVSTPGSPDWQYRNTNLVEFEHRIIGERFFTAAQIGNGGFSYQPGIEFSRADYFQINKSTNGHDFKIEDATGFEIQAAPLPAAFVLRLRKAVALGGAIWALLRLECSFRETVDPGQQPGPR